MFFNNFQTTMIMTDHRQLYAFFLTMPCSGTAACTLRLTTCARAGQCCGGLKPLLGSVPLVLVVGTLAGCPRVSYTFMCSLLPCLAALWEEEKRGVSMLLLWDQMLCVSPDSLDLLLCARFASYMNTNVKRNVL